jgi:hypothetical protein
MGGYEIACQVVVGKLGGKRPVGRPRRRREENIKISLTEIEWWLWSGFIWLKTRASGELL